MARFISSEESLPMAILTCFRAVGTVHTRKYGLHEFPRAPQPLQVNPAYHHKRISDSPCLKARAGAKYAFEADVGKAKLFDIKTGKRL
jgi:hypothetical protein